MVPAVDRPQTLSVLRVAVAAVLGAALSSPAKATTFKQTVGGYGDNQGLARQRLGLDVSQTLQPTASALTTAKFAVQGTRDLYQRTRLGQDEYSKEVYGTGSRTTDSGTVSASQTWRKLTDTRAAVSLTSDGRVSARSFGVGASQWLFGESLRLGIDVTRTMVEQPLFPVLDVDFQTVANPTLASATATAVTLRHLATPTTMVDYGATYVVTSNRPDTRGGSVAVRQFIPPADGAVHMAVTRAINRGRLTAATTYGQVDAWIYEGAYVQNLGPGTRCRAGWRSYREDEITRAFGDELALGTDWWTIGIGHEWSRRDAPVGGIPLLVEINGGRYLTNTGLAANVLEASLTGRF